MKRTAVIFLLLSLVHIRGARVARYSSATDHFIFSIDIRKSAKLARSAALFETCFAKLTAFFEYVPKKTIRVWLSDEDDIGNGWTYGTQGWIVINLAGARFNYRGERRWLPTVISHELAHLLTLQKMGLDRKFLGIWLSSRWLHGNFLEHREETYLPYRDIPNWLAEGLAQYGSQVCGFDTLDSRREMLLRTAWLSGRLLSLKEMSSFAWDGRGNELVYNQGYYFVHYLYNRFGAETVNRMLHLRRSLQLGIAFEKAFGRDLPALFGEWRKTLDQQYSGFKPDPVRLLASGDIPAGEAVLQQGNATGAGPSNQIFFTSSRPNDFGLASLYVKSTDGYITRLRYSVEPFLRQSPQRDRLLFIARKKYVRHGALTNELYELDASSFQPSRLTSKGRIISADFDIKGEIYAVRESGGTTEFGRIRGRQFITIPLKPAGLEIRDIRRGENAGLFYAVVAGPKNSDIYQVRTSNETIEPVSATPANETDPIFEAERLFFSADFDGVFNIYSKKDGALSRHTSMAAGGAFQPHVRDGELYYTAYTPRGYLLASQTLETAEAGMVLTSALPPPSPQSLEVPLRYSYQKNSIKYLGAGLFFEFTGHPKQGVDIPVLNQEKDSLVRFDTAMVPAFRELSLGGQFIWLHPAGEAAFSLAAALSRHAVFSSDGESYLSLLDIGYFIQFSLLSLDALLHFESVHFPDVDLPEGLYRPVFSQAALGTALSIPAGRYGRLAATAELSLGILTDREGTIDAFAFGGPPLFGGVAGYQRLNPGRDFINSGKALNSFFSFGVGPQDIILGGGSANIFFNIARRLFIHGFSGLQVVSSTQSSGLGGMAGASLFTHLPLSSRGGSHRGILPKRIFPFAAVNTSSRGLEDTNMPYFLKNHLNHRPDNSWGPVYRISPPDIFTGNTDRSTSCQAGLLLKVVSVFSHAAFWTAAVSFNPGDPARELVWYLRIEI